MKRLLPFFAALGTLAAQNPPALPPFVSPFLRAEVLVVRLPTERAMALQSEFRDPPRAAAAQDKLLALVKTKDAQLIDWPVLTSTSGNRAVTQNVEDVRYATSYQTPRIISHPSVDPTSVQVKEPKASETPSQTPAKDNGLTVVGGAPSDFETRQVGVIVELEMNLRQDDQTVDVQLAVQHVELLGYRREKLEIDQKYSVVAEQPEFQRQQTTTQLSLPLGQVHLLAFHQLKKPENTVELFVVKFSRLDLPKAAAPASPSPAPHPR